MSIKNVIDKAKRAPKYAADIWAKNYGDYLVNHKKFSKGSYCPADIFFLQVKDGSFTRPDMIIRHLAIDNYYGNNDFGFELYRKLQDARVKKGYAAEAVKKFYALIDSYEKNGYDESSYIIADKNLKLRDGSHRMAMALYLNLSQITVAVYNSTTALVLDYNWLLQHGFSADEVELLRRTADTLREQLNAPLKCILRSSRDFAVDKAGVVLAKHGTVLKREAVSLTPQQAEAVGSLYSIGNMPQNCVLIELKLHSPMYQKLKFARQPIFAQTADIKKELGELAEMLVIPANFRENALITEILE